MVPCQDLQLEKLVDEALKHGDFQALEQLLQDEGSERTNPKCSKLFINKLDKLINRELDNGKVKNACLGLSCLHKFGTFLTTPGGLWLSGTVTQGLVKKWYGKARDIWVEAGEERNETLLSLAEDFFDALMVVHGANKEGKYHVTESFLHSIGQLTAESRVHIMIQKEAIRKLNLILDKLPSELKKEKKILLTAEVSAMMNKLASRILEVGDYDLQIALMEALCRMTNRTQRQELADHWFPMEFVASAFSKIQDSEFETDCRKFLNLVNGMQGDRRRVYSYPCQEVFLGKHELLMPMDEKLEEFWIDFNLGSQSISFYFSLAKEEAEEGQWDTICIPENEVHSYIVEEARSSKILKLKLIDPLCVGSVEGSELHIRFSHSLDIMQTVINVYGNAKNKRFVGKSSTSVVKTTVQIVLDEGSSQVLVPESQVSQTLCEMERNISPSIPGSQELRAVRPLLPQAPRQRPLQYVTPARRKVSESNSFISSAGRSVCMSPSIDVLPPATPVLRAKVKPALEMVTSVERKSTFYIRDLMVNKTSDSTPCKSTGKQSVAVAPVENRLTKLSCGPGPGAEKFQRSIPVDKVVEMVQSGQEHEEPILDDSANMVPDSQPAWRKKRPGLPAQVISESSKKKPAQEQKKHKGPFSQPYFPPTPFPQAPSHRTSSAPSQDQCTQPFPVVDLQKRPSSAQHFSGAPSHKQLHTQLTQQLEDLLRERERAGGRGEHEDEAQKEWGTGTAALTKGRTGAPAGKDPLHRSLQPTPAKASHRATPLPGCSPSVREEGCSSSAKRKVGPVEMTRCMTSFISSQYKTPTAAASGSGSGKTSTEKSRSNVAKSWMFTSMEKGTTNISGFLKSTSDSNEIEEKPGYDVYSFKSDSPKSARLKAIKSPEKSVAEKSAIKGPKNFSKSVKKNPAVKPPGRYVKKHLFSDTDTDNKTDVSWLKASSRKPKPKVMDYSRQRPTKPAPPADSSYESKSLPTPLSKPVEKQVKPTKNQRKHTEKREKKPSAAVSKLSGRPQRAAAASKNYKDPSESDSSSQSESEELTNRKNQAKGNTKKGAKTDQAVEVVKKKPVSPAEEESEKPTAAEEESEKPTAAEEQPVLQKELWAARFAAFSPSPSPIERMRSVENAAPLTASPITPLRSLCVSPPEALPLSREASTEPFRGIHASSFYGMERGSRGKTPSFPSLAPVCQTAPTPPLSPSQAPRSPSLPLLTSTALEQNPAVSLPNSPSLEDQLEAFGDSQGQPVSLDKESLMSLSSQIQSSQKSVTLGKLPFSHKQRETAQLLEHKSGPSYGVKRRTSQHSSLSSEEEEEEEEEEGTAMEKAHGLGMRPRKLFKPMDRAWEQERASSFACRPKEEETSHEEEDTFKQRKGAGGSAPPQDLRESTSGSVRDMEVRSVVSSRMVSSFWEASVEGEMDLEDPEFSTSQYMGSLCRQFNSELQKKFQSRSRRMELFAKQSLKNVQQHVSSISVQVHQYRSQKLEKIRSVLLEEISNLEQDETNLKNMEKELTTYWRKQTQALRSYQEREVRRLQHLKSTFQKNVHHSLEYEERIFTSEMCLMKEGMRSAQEKLFKDMQEEELLNVRRGLQALFLPEGCRF